MLRGLILVALGAGLGVLTGRYILPPPAPKQPSQPGRSGLPPLARISGDMLNACEQARPLLLTLQRTTADGRTSASDMAEIVQQINRLQRAPGGEMSAPAPPPVPSLPQKLTQERVGEVVPYHDLLIVTPLAAAGGALVSGGSVAKAAGSAAAAAIVVALARHLLTVRRLRNPGGSVIPVPRLIGALPALPRAPIPTHG